MSRHSRPDTASCVPHPPALDSTRRTADASAAARIRGYRSSLTRLPSDSPSAANRARCQPPPRRDRTNGRPWDDATRTPRDSNAKALASSSSTIALRPPYVPYLVHFERTAFSIAHVCAARIRRCAVVRTCSPSRRLANCIRTTARCREEPPCSYHATTQRKNVCISKEASRIRARSASAGLVTPRAHTSVASRGRKGPHSTYGRSPCEQKPSVIPRPYPWVRTLSEPAYRWPVDVR
ncbi:hypothetical protein BD310DRAFT_931416 [Dichomitus squalens]|uniref:Uncharacterized protein n=1 Tax=Dichomitus squalens TaxID=114155 RepID=A0A4Q9PQ62_9APHY|nr:hypothetical protein BD310DRAFT_931416 [Dichomitus squalens]